ncbi:Rne/Rng family ribonuclease [Serinibacter arcticus]|uniref:Ribonuclease E n=1 Tax=Serinibacter arcticus TaxID=1655435 RepID=A0A4Z1DZ94_9MICO|nr:Rne/Rng family ribonuclease [Serinibacter arcticus]TGO04310.1 Cytoplasmic axial filament protein CafA and Ribonuclease G [Serinibacter arcticus]
MATDDNSVATGTDAGEGAAAAPAPRRRAPRRATRGVVTTPDAPAASATPSPTDEQPAPASQTAAAAPVAAAPAAEPVAAAEAAPAAAPRKRAPRRASTASVVTPAEVVEPSSATAAAAVEAGADERAEAVEAPEAPKKARAPRKSRAKAAAEPVTEAAPVDEPVAAQPAPADEAPAPLKKPRRSRAKKVAEPEVAAEPVEPETAQPAADDAVDGETPTASSLNPFSAPRTVVAPTRDPEQRIDVLAAFGLGTAAPVSRTAAAQPTEPEPAEDEVDEDAEDEQAPETETEDPRLPAAALLFQPPTARRRRRRSDDAEGSEAASTTGAGAADPAPTEQAGEQAGEQQPSGRSRGRRSGRRGGRREETPVVDETTTVEDDVELDLDVDAVDPEDTATGAAEDENDDEADGDRDQGRRRRRRGGRGRKRPVGGESDDDGESDTDTSATERDSDVDTDGGAAAADAGEGDSDAGDDDGAGSSRRRRRRRGRRSEDGGSAPASAAPARAPRDEVTALKGSTRLEAKRLRRREGRDAGRRRQIITEAEFLARRESVQRDMVVRERAGMTQIAVMEDGVLVEHYVAQEKQTSMVGNVYLGRVQNVLPSMEAAFVDLGKGRNAVLYAGEVNWEAAGLEGQPRRIEQALKSGDQILVQVTKDPIGHKGARLTSQITLAGRYLVLVPSGAMTGISRKLPENERARLKKLLKEIVPAGQGVIVRTAAEGASEEELRRDVERLTGEWADISARTSAKKVTAPALLKGEPELALRVVRDVFNEDFASLTVAGNGAWETISGYVTSVAPDLAERLHHWSGGEDVFASKRIDEQLAKGMDRKVWLPSGGSLVIDRTEAMTVVDVNTGKFTGSGGTLEETVTRNNLEAAEEIVRQLRLRDIGGIIVVDFIDMVLESNRDLVLRRLIECLGRDRTRHQVAEVTSLGLVQMTRKRVGQGLVEAFSTPCEHCHGRGFMVSSQPHEHVEPEVEQEDAESSSRGSRRRGGRATRTAGAPAPAPAPAVEVDPAAREAVKATLAQIAAAAQHAHDHDGAEGSEVAVSAEDAVSADGAPDEAGTESAEETPSADEAGTDQVDTDEVGAEAPAEDAVASEADEDTAGA